MFVRLSEKRLASLAAQFPVVLILGPRQCGKTTLARRAIKGRYFDLERPSDLQVFSEDIEFALQRFDEPLVFDEVQSLPPLFNVLRALVDEKRGQNGRYYLLGSVSPELVRGISESLAGRVGILELTPFLLCEVAGHKDLAIESLWFHGGFPDACLAASRDEWRLWQDNYTRTFIERDVARHGLRMSPVDMRRLMVMLAHCHGGVLNASELGRSLGFSYHTVQHCLDILEGYFLVRRLEPYFGNIGKRLVKAPKVYIRDSGVLHALLNVNSPRELLESPARGASWEGFMIEQIVSLANLQSPGARFHYFRTHTGAEIDLIVDRGQTRIGFEFKCAGAASPRDWSHLKAAIAAGIIQKGLLVYLGAASFPVSDSISVISAAELLTSEADAFHELTLPQDR